MSAIEYREYTLLCDADGCTRTFGPLRGEPPRAQVRRKAAKLHWTHVRSESGRKYDRDFCPDHKPAEAA